MHRRDLLKALAAGGALATLGCPAHAAPAGWREFEISYLVKLETQHTPARLWLPVPQDALDYQRVVDLSWRSPATVSLQWEGESRAPIVGATWLDLGMAREIEVTARVQTRDRSGFYPDASPDELAMYLRPTPSSPNSQPGSLSPTSSGIRCCCSWKRWPPNRSMQAPTCPRSRRCSSREPRTILSTSWQRPFRTRNTSRRPVIIAAR